MCQTGSGPVAVCQDQAQWFLHSTLLPGQIHLGQVIQNQTGSGPVFNNMTRRKVRTNRKKRKKQLELLQESSTEPVLEVWHRLHYNTHTHTHTHTYTQITIYFQFYIWTARQVESNFFFIRISQLYESQYTERTLTKTLNFVQVIKILNNETLLVKMDYAEHNPNWPTWGRLGHPWSRSGSSKSGSFQESCADAFSANHCICELFYLQRSQKSFWQCHHQHSPHIHSQ